MIPKSLNFTLRREIVGMETGQIQRAYVNVFWNPQLKRKIHSREGNSSMELSLVAFPHMHSILFLFVLPTSLRSCLSNCKSPSRSCLPGLCPQEEAQRMRREVGNQREGCPGCVISPLMDNAEKPCPPETLYSQRWLPVGILRVTRSINLDMVTCMKLHWNFKIS